MCLCPILYFSHLLAVKQKQVSIRLDLTAYTSLKESCEINSYFIPHTVPWNQKLSDIWKCNFNILFLLLFTHTYQALLMNTKKTHLTYTNCAFHITKLYMHTESTNNPELFQKIGNTIHYNIQWKEESDSKHNVSSYICGVFTHIFFLVNKEHDNKDRNRCKNEISSHCEYCL